MAVQLALTFPFSQSMEMRARMIWNPIEQRIYKQIATAAYKDRKFFDVRGNPDSVLSDGLTIYLGLGLCKSAEEVVDYKRFREAIQKKKFEKKVPVSLVDCCFLAVTTCCIE